MDTFQTYKSVFEDNPDAIVIVDDAGQILLVNKQAENLFGYQKEEMIEKKIELLIPECFNEKHIAERKAYSSKPVVRTMGSGLDIMAKRKDGSEFPVEIRLSPIKHPEKTVIAAAIRNVSERKQIQAQLLENEKKYRTTLDNMLEGVRIFDFEFRYLYANNAGAKHSRHSKEELLGYTLMEKFPGIEETEIFKTFQVCQVERINKQVEVEFAYPDNSKGWFELSIQPVPEGIFVLSIDITERKKAENELKESEERYRSLVQNTNELIIMISAGGEIADLNPAFQKAIEYSDAEIKEMNIFDLLDPISIPLVKETIVKTFAGEKIEFVERIFKTKSGKKIYVEGNLTPTRFSNGEVKGVQAFFRNVTERKKAEQEIAHQKEFTEAILNNLPADIAVFDNNHNYVFLNEHAISRPEFRQWMIGKNDFDYCRYKGIDDALAHKRRKLFNDALQAKTDVEWIDEHQTNHGSTIFILRKFHPVYETEQVRYVIGYGVDITKRMKIEEELLQTRKQFQHVLNSSPVIIYSALTTNNYAPTYVSENIKVQLGYEAREFIDFGSFWVNHIHPEDSEHVFSEVYLLFENEKHTMEYRFLHKNGTYRWLLDEMKLVRDDQGNPKEVVGAWMDITDRKNADLKLKDAMLSTQKAYKELEQFAHMVSHDLQEPLRMVTGFLNLLKLETEGQLDESAKEYIYYAVDGADRMRTLIQDLLQYSRVGSNKEDFTEINLDEVLKYVIHVLDEKIQATKAAVKVNTLPVISGHKSLLNQLFMNLLGNALKYHSNENPEIEIGCREEEDKWVFYVKDNGIGIEPKFFDKIFIIFQRIHARSEYAGTGIGLAICKKIVEKHGGHIWVESDMGKGSTFFFTIPKKII
ncbi:MAG: hypothetical protein JWQ09_5540 [Segetibacter sp.]|nr:hypothetical protein [Segetibacter sp.]